MPPILRWGILGAGNIAHQFAAALSTSTDTLAVAVASRSPDVAQQFAQQYKIPTASSYEDLLLNPQVDAVYISLPNSLHHEWTLKSLRAAKHVLCEKPLAASAPQAIEMFDLAKKAGLLLMEAFMYRFHPQTHAVLHALSQNAIGQIHLIKTSFCYRTTNTASNIRFRKDLAGGALMDVGSYCINFSRLIAQQEPAQLSATASLHQSGIDHLTTAFLKFPNQILASFTCSMNTHAENSAWICGSLGHLQIPIPWKPPTKSHFIISQSTPPKMDTPHSPPKSPPPPQIITTIAQKNLYAYEADAFAQTLHNNLPPALTPEDSIGNMHALDHLRRQIGLLPT